ncbi:hypothetical protein PAAG_01944 [Paracoccidioides lutzii Pb01]|uniref:Uncharacterized protein n=1 Tax=Paracoccidioides lutzii (strain ATCC MYA-826 / Pb01) TaxID=502779 RepID=C1GTU9_PARBA|nr:hypothetical protein PAAG_01944 [Paracoccidioides lutzii Pb01]EEH39755.2 hypothetical protein PAAG_01944 [Paracoccidioides lutzii Pb01]
MDFEKRLVDALKEQSEALQNINDQFDYSVEETRAAPIPDNTGRCAVAADHRRRNKCFRSAISALRRTVCPRCAEVDLHQTYESSEDVGGEPGVPGLLIVSKVFRRRSGSREALNVQFEAPPASGVQQ